MKNARQSAFEILLKIEKDGAYSNLTIDSTLSSAALDARDKAFVSALVYGVTERKLTVDYQLSLYLTKPLKKLRPEALIILRLGAYQLLFMDKVPSSAAVNESVKLTRANKCAYASSLVNAVLRAVSENGLRLPKENSENYLSVKYSCPVWLCEKWIREYGRRDAEQLLASSVGASETVLRVNTVKTSSEELLKSLRESGVNASSGYIENSLVLNNAGSIERLGEYKNGLFHVQDTASQLCAAALEAKSGQIVFDVCSAPGGKAFTVAQMMKNEGEIYAFDIYPHRVKLISEGAKRLGLSCVKALEGDASKLNGALPKADRVLCDAPCSGLGIIRRKPEIKYKSEIEISSLPEIQLQILKTASSYLKPGGRLVYSTCTLNRAENEDVVSRFLAENDGFKAVPPLANVSGERFLTLMPHKNNCDGFFIAALERKGTV